MHDEQVAVTFAGPVDVRRTMAPLRHGRHDPTHQVVPDGVVWRTTVTSSGPATLRVEQLDPTSVRVTAWGAGSAEAVALAPGLVGAWDDPTGFTPGPGPVREAFRRTWTVRLTRSGRVLESLVPMILEQRVITRTATDAWRWLVRHHGSCAPGPAPDGMRVAPDARTWAGVPSWDFHRAGVDPRRARTVVAAARLAPSLERAVVLPAQQALALLRQVPGVGPWTAAETAQRAFGDPDAVTVGDFHLPHQVGWALAGRRTDDAGMLALLEPFRGHRHRAVRHLMLAGAAREPRRAPRLAVEDHRRR
ncbi:DNA-3-methyladenine glycosylase family protein [Cellulomonas bogoriensis]|uniref:DNA-3-methyladenine glycosylase II n=1 Tax=Cellulomonas bogoriensis 69B4 = DSM 16987 TaxID=1386082 RepID=A0A0A0BY92_9CELL|nr:DNA-3-methyladenine glycosylase [Cellulomonas bogoriensis]KGM12935.1 3-methyladenine DNA glycosylase [Cellulomonas bogoriensis 69B4 = DSM 16987]